MTKKEKALLSSLIEKCEALADSKWEQGENNLWGEEFAQGIWHVTDIIKGAMLNA